MTRFPDTRVERIAEEPHVGCSWGGRICGSPAFGGGLLGGTEVAAWLPGDGV